MQLYFHPCQDAQTFLTTDASDAAMGAVLQQLDDGVWFDSILSSQKLRQTEKKYSAFDCKMLALYLGICYFRYSLEGRQFIAFTDHKLLTFCMTKVSDSWSHHQQRQLSHIYF